MDAGETRRNGKTGTDGDFFVTVDPRNWKRLKEEVALGRILRNINISTKATLDYYEGSVSHG
jgi:hypothetical protein